MATNREQIGTTLCAIANYVREIAAPFTCRSPMRQIWMTIAIGRSGINVDVIFTSSIGTMVTSRHDETGPDRQVDHYISDDDAPYKEHATQREDIEQKYGAPLRFYSAPGVASRKVFDFTKTDVFDQSRWPEYYDWLTERVIRMKDVMGKRV